MVRMGFLHRSGPAVRGCAPGFVFATVRRHLCGGLQIVLVRRALCRIAPRSTPKKLFLTAVTVIGLGCIVAWPPTEADGEL
jgi:hypothetical protein